MASRTLKLAVGILPTLLFFSSITLAAKQQVFVPGDPTADVAATLVGTWNLELTVEKPKRHWEERRLQIQSVTLNSTGGFNFEGTYSWAGATVASPQASGGPVSGQIDATADGPTIAFLTAAHNSVRALWIERNRFSGSFEVRFDGPVAVVPTNLKTDLTKIGDPRKIVVSASSNIDVKELLQGEWSALLSKDPLPRRWRIESVRELSDETLEVNGEWGAASSLTPVTAKIAMYDNGANLSLVTSGGLSISAVWVSPQAIVGRYQDGGRTDVVRLVKGETGIARPITKDTKITVLFVSAFDCKYCHYWKVTDERDFAASDDFKQVSYRVIEAGHFSDIGRDDDWPADLRRIRDRLHLTAGTPRFYVLLDDTIVASAFGPGEWSNFLLPRIHQFIQQKVAASK